MSQNLSGFRAIFSHALIYNLAQRAIGAERARRLLVRDYFPQQESYRLLDIGCGTAEILRHLPASVDYHGFDASETYIDAARKRFGNRGTFHAELVREATLGDMEPFDMVLAFGLLHHLDDSEAETLFVLAYQALNPGGRLITIDPVYVDKQSSIARWLISKDRGEAVRTSKAYAELAKQHFATGVHCEVRHDMLNLPYSHQIMVCEKP